MERRNFRLPDAVFNTGLDDITPQPLALVKDGLDAAIQSGMMKRNSYRICPDTDAITVDAGVVDEFAVNLFDTKDSNQRQLADAIVAQAIRGYRRQQAPVPVELSHDAMPVMLSA